MLAPTLIIVGTFVYVFILINGYVSVSNWGSQTIDLSVADPLVKTYGDMVGMPSFQASFRNTVLFTLFFLMLAVGGGLGLAILLHRSFATRKEIRGKSFFRSLFMFPYALSFVVTGVVWRWLFNPETGVNVLFDIFGINKVLAAMGQGPLQPGHVPRCRQAPDPVRCPTRPDPGGDRGNVAAVRVRDDDVPGRSGGHPGRRR
jgi:glucose/mannose transport system permease protein